MLAKEERRRYGGDYIRLSSDDEPYEERTSSRRKQHSRHHRSRSPVYSRRRPPIPNYRSSRRRSSSPPAFNNRGHRSRSRYNRHQSRVDVKKEVKLKRKRPRRDSSVDHESIDLTQLNAALRYSENNRRRQENPLAKRLKLHEEHSNKENDSDDDEELIALRLQALQSKQEVKELTEESLSLPAPTDVWEPEDEYELRMIALKSAITKKAETRRLLNRKPYSPTDTLILSNASPAPCEESDNESNNNMEISPPESPSLDDAVLQPIDMDIATPDNVSNSPTFFNIDDSNSIPHSSLTLPPVIDPIPVHPTITTTKSGLPIGLASLPVQEEIKENLGKRQNTRSPSNLIVIQPTTKNDKQQNIVKLADKAQLTSLTDDSEEIALRTMLLAGLKNPQKSLVTTVSTQETEAAEASQPNGINLNNSVKRFADNEEKTKTIEDNLKRAANRIKCLTVQEQTVIETSLDMILGGSETGYSQPKESPKVNLKEVVERLKQKNNENSPVRTEIDQPTTQLLLDIPPPPSITIPGSTEVEKTTDKQIAEMIKVPDVPINIKESQVQTQPRISQVQSTEPPVRPEKILSQPLVSNVTENRVMSVIMKRKVKTKSSIVNVPFQVKPLKSLPKPNSNDPKVSLNSSSATSSFKSNLTDPIPGPSRITDFESYLRPVPKLVIQLGQSSSESSSSESNDNSAFTELDSSKQSKLASPSHIVEYSTFQDASVSYSTEEQTDKNGATDGANPLFEFKLEQFLKQARDKTEKEAQSQKEKAAAANKEDLAQPQKSLKPGPANLKTPKKAEVNLKAPKTPVVSYIIYHIYITYTIYFIISFISLFAIYRYRHS